jgi:hypothetical protein
VPALLQAVCVLSLLLRALRLGAEGAALASLPNDQLVAAAKGFSRLEGMDAPGVCCGRRCVTPPCTQHILAASPPKRTAASYVRFLLVASGP